ncbi:MAG: hypothetical protein IPI49_10865 [Myxococcales bacterium]|nr:hypothetical protein [Myxococcales bacterium]
MLFITTLTSGTRKQILAPRDLGSLINVAALDPFQKMALMKLIKDPERHVFGFMEGPRLLQTIQRMALGSGMGRQERDERGNVRLFTARETDLAINPFFNESFALNELHKVMRRALQEGLLEVTFASIELTYHDVPQNQQHRFLNVRAFTGEVMFPRLTQRFRKKDRLLRKMTTVETAVDRDYLEFRVRFREPTAPDQPTRRGRKEIQVDDYDFGRPGIMAPSTEQRIALLPLTVPAPLSRTRPGKVSYVPPEEDEDDLTNRAERQRRRRDFPFGAGPSGSMAYDLAVYKYYLEHWKGIAPNSVELRERLLMFGISRAMGYVKYGHHSFYEALITLKPYVTDPQTFKTPDNLYAFILSYLEHGIRHDDPKYRSQKRYINVIPLKVHWDAYGGDWLDWRSYGYRNYQPWTITVQQGAPVGLQGAGIAQGLYIYVILAIDKSVRYLPTSPQGEQYRSHSQLAGGLSVLAAGYFELGANNVLLWIDNSSGHYKPGAPSVDYAKKRLGKLRFDVATAESRAHVPAPTTGLQAITGPVTGTIVPYARIGVAWTRYMLNWQVGRTRSFPTPPQDLLPYMPY